MAGARSSLQAGTLWHVELRHAIAAFPADRGALRHEQRVAGDGGQHAAIRGRKPHAAVQQVHELVEAVGANDATRTLLAAHGFEPFTRPDIRLRSQGLLVRRVG
jgi:hypothetical protein